VIYPSVVGFDGRIANTPGKLFMYYVAETDAALEQCKHLGKFLDHTLISPTNPAVMSPCFIEDDGRLCLFFNIGPRLRNKIALAISESR
jgi:hypothetical protein